jgi:hypothetical protein
VKDVYQVNVHLCGDAARMAENLWRVIFTTSSLAAQFESFALCFALFDTFNFSQESQSVVEGNWYSGQFFVAKDVCLISLSQIRLVSAGGTRFERSFFAGFMNFRLNNFAKLLQHKTNANKLGISASSWNFRQISFIVDGKSFNAK